MVLSIFSSVYWLCGCLLRSFAHFKIWLFLFLLSCRILYIFLDIGLLSYKICKCFLQFCGLSFVSWQCLWNAVFYFDEVQFICLLWLFMLLVSCLRVHCQIHVHKYLPTSFLQRVLWFYLLHFNFWFILCLFLYIIRHRGSASFLCMWFSSCSITIC